jgi:hypothetical protein
MKASQITPNGFFTIGYGAGPIKFFRILEQWQQAGTFNGINFGK